LRNIAKGDAVETLCEKCFVDFYLVYVHGAAKKVDP